MYEMKLRVRLSEVSADGCMTLPGIINAFQDTSIFQSEDLGVGTEFLKENKKAWVLSSWQVEVVRYPKLGEHIRINTWASAFHGFFGDRNFVMKDEDDQVVAYANSIWVYMDLVSGRPAKPSEEEVGRYGIEPPFPMEYASRKVPMPQEGVAKPPLKVRKYHIDTNHHVNNCGYVQMAVELLEEEGMETDFSELRVEYKKSAVYGDVIYPVLQIEGETARTALCDEAGKPYAIVELKYKGEQKNEIGRKASIDN